MTAVAGDLRDFAHTFTEHTAFAMWALRAPAQCALRSLFAQLYRAAVDGDASEAAQLMRLIEAKLSLEWAFIGSEVVP